MADSARLIDSRIPSHPEGVALVLHGGGARQHSMRVSATQLSVLRMIPVARRVDRVSRHRIAVLRLLNSRRGWDTGHTPVSDVEWALAEVATRFGSDVPVCLIGHSLGGRAALLTADRPQVRGVVALAPWVYPHDVVRGVAGTPIVVVHGDEDRIASPARSRVVAERLARETGVSYVTVTGGKHAMLRRREAFDGLAARCAAWMLLGETDDPIVERIAAGDLLITV